jgi:hypothetical protein
MASSFGGKWDAIADGILGETCGFAAVTTTTEMKQCLREGVRRAQPFVAACINWLAASGGGNIEEALTQPEIAGAEALQRYEDAVQLDDPVAGWLNLGKKPSRADEVLIYTLELVVYRMIADGLLDPPASQLAA